MFKSCIIDGELIKTYNNGELVKIDFYAFDLLFFNGIDIRND